MNRTAIRCSCGQRVSAREVLHTGYYPRMFGPSLVYVRYRCSRCRKRGEQRVTQEEWESGILKEVTMETSAPEQVTFGTLGPIEIRELVEFHDALESMPSLDEIRAEFTSLNEEVASEEDDAHRR